MTVINEDPMAHSVTSEAAVGRYTPDAVSGVSFNTGAFTGEMSFTLPNGAAGGTVIPYYCTVHSGTMNTPNATITVTPSRNPVERPAAGCLAATRPTRISPGAPQHRPLRSVYESGPPCDARFWRNRASA